MGHDLAMSPALVGGVVTLTQVGYGLGLFFLVPLGDMPDRRRLIVAQLLLLMVALTVVATASTAAVLSRAWQRWGFSPWSPRRWWPSRPPRLTRERGRIVGLVTSGVVIGILLARTVSGLLADLAGWRSVYLSSAALTTAARPGPAPGITAPQRAPPTSRATDDSCVPRSPCSRRAPPSRPGPVRPAGLRRVQHPVEQRRAAAQRGARFLSHSEIGALGLIGAAGALAATVAGRLNDRGLSRRTTGIALALLAVSRLPLAFTRTRSGRWSPGCCCSTSRCRRSTSPIRP